MAESPDILIGNPGGQHVQIRPLSRSLSGLFDAREGAWIDCDVEIVAGAFQGTFRADFQSEEFRTFLEDVEALQGTPDHVASFSATEGQLVLSLDGADGHAIRLSGEAVDVVDVGNRLQFGFEVERGSLPAICRSLESLLAAYPADGQQPV